MSNTPRAASNPRSHTPSHPQSHPQSQARFAEGRFLSSGHAQTLAVALPLFAPPKRFARVVAGTEELRVPLEGGELVAHAWFHPDPPGASRKTAVLVHGVGGTSLSTYMLRTGVALYEAGYHVVRINLRGSGESVVVAPSLYHGGLTEDLNVLLARLARDARVGGVVVVGYSLGGNMVLRAASEWGDTTPAKVKAVATVSAPLDLAPASRNFESAEAFAYRVYILRSLIQQAIRFRTLYPERASTYTRRGLARIRQLSDYDDVVVAPMHGFKDAWDYYATQSSGPVLSRIRIPTRIVHAEDDPMVPFATVEPFTHALPGGVEFVRAAHGGHVAFFRTWAEAAFVRSWATERLLPFLDEATR